MPDLCVDNTTVLSTIIASSLLIVSEILPYFTSIKGDGITQVIIGALKAFIKKEQDQKNDIEHQAPAQSEQIVI